MHFNTHKILASPDEIHWKSERSITLLSHFCGLHDTTYLLVIQLIDPDNYVLSLLHIHSTTMLAVIYCMMLSVHVEPYGIRTDDVDRSVWESFFRCACIGRRDRWTSVVWTQNVNERITRCIHGETKQNDSILTGYNNMWCDLGESIGSQTCDIFSFLFDWSHH